MSQSASTAAAPAKKKGMNKSLRESLIAYSFIAPNFIGFCVFTLIPIVCAICTGNLQRSASDKEIQLLPFDHNICFLLHLF